MNCDFRRIGKWMVCQRDGCGNRLPVANQDEPWRYRACCRIGRVDTPQMPCPERLLLTASVPKLLHEACLAACGTPPDKGCYEKTQWARREWEKKVMEWLQNHAQPLEHKHGHDDQGRGEQ